MISLNKKLNHYLKQKKRLHELLTSEFKCLENIEKQKNDVTLTTYLSLKNEHKTKIRILKVYLVDVNTKIKQIKDEIYVESIQKENSKNDNR